MGTPPIAVPRSSQWQQSRTSVSGTIQPAATRGTGLCNGPANSAGTISTIAIVMRYCWSPGPVRRLPLADRVPMVSPPLVVHRDAATMGHQSAYHCYSVALHRIIQWWAAYNHWGDHVSMCNDHRDIAAVSAFKGHSGCDSQYIQCARIVAGRNSHLQCQ